MINNQSLHAENRQTKASPLRLAQVNPLVQKTYEYEFPTTLKHSNATQNIYFSNYFEWQGTVRERWFFECIAPDMLQNEGVFITKTAHNKFLKEAFPFQTVRCSLSTFLIQRCSFYLAFKFYVDDDLASVGYQQIVFASHEKKITRLSPNIIAKIRRYEGESVLEN